MQSSTKYSLHCHIINIIFSSQRKMLYVVCLEIYLTNEKNWLLKFSLTYWTNTIRIWTLSLASRHSITLWRQIPLEEVPLESLVLNWPGYGSVAAHMQVPRLNPQYCANKKNFFKSPKNSLSSLRSWLSY